MSARSRVRRFAFAAGAAVLGAALWWRKHPSACPYGQSFWVEALHPLITRDRLRGVLEPQPGELVLEVGPGTGYYTLDAAGWISSDGQLDIFDLQPEMLARSRPGADVVDVLTHEQLIHEAPAIVGRRTPSPLAPATTRAHGTRQTEPERDEPCWHCSACYGLPVS